MLRLTRQSVVLRLYRPLRDTLDELVVHGTTRYDHNPNGFIPLEYIENLIVLGDDLFVGPA